MDEYIKRKDLLDEYDRVHQGPPGGARKLIEEAPACDVSPVVRGYWIEETFESIIPAEIDMFGNVTMKTYTINKCSVCGRKEHDKEPYCNCGAKMDCIEEVEICPFCDKENVYPMWDTEKQGFVVRCQHCGEEILLCDACLHTVCEDGEHHECDWRLTDCGSKCHRGETKWKKEKHDNE